MEHRGSNPGSGRIMRVVGAWFVLVILGMGLLARHEFTPAPVAHAAQVWPAQVGVRTISGRPSVILFVHPNCPCSAASMEEFARLITRVGSRVDAHVVVYSWEGEPDDPRQSRPWKAASILPDVELYQDLGGDLARRFGIATSGHVLLYDGSGNLLFSGGITGSRGHAGDNAGLAAIAMLLEKPNTLAAAPATTPVFGCAILPEAN